MQTQLFSQLDRHISHIKTICNIDEVFVVGGAVRDILLWKSDYIVDVDLTMRSDPEKLWNKITANKPLWVDIFRTEKFGTITIITWWESIYAENSWKIKYEITPFREESGYEDFRHPDKILWSDSLVADASRRDFTINAMYYYSLGKAIDNSQIVILTDQDVISNMFARGRYNHDIFISYCQQNNIDDKEISWIVLDPYGWVEDLQSGKIRCVWDPDRRLSEDPLRILRAIRFQNSFNFSSEYDLDKWISFDYEKNTWLSMKKNYFLVKKISKERIHEEVIKVFSWPNPFWYISILDELNLLKYIFPSVYNIKWLHQPVRYHPFDVYSHTLLALHYLQSINTDPLVRLAMLYHDVGKVEQYYSHTLHLQEQDRSFIYGSWLNHVTCGVDMVEEDFSRIWFGNKEIQTISRYVAMHMKPGEILISQKENQPKKIRALLSEGDYNKCHNLLDICMWDRIWHYNPIQPPELEWVNHLRDLLDEIYNSEWQFTIHDMKINWEDIMKHYKIDWWPQVGKYLRRARDRVLENPEDRNNKKKILTYLDKISS